MHKSWKQVLMIAVILLSASTWSNANTTTARQWQTDYADKENDASKIPFTRTLYQI